MTIKSKKKTKADYVREARLREVEAEAAVQPRFVCVKCGREFETDSGLFLRGRRRKKHAIPTSMFVLIGGRKWCSRCAKARFPRRSDPLSPVGADRIEFCGRPVATRINF